MDIQPGKAELIEDRSTFTLGPGSSYGILSTPSTKDHMRMRRNLHHGFSGKALRDWIMKYVEFLIQRLREHSKDGKHRMFVPGITIRHSISPGTPFWGNHFIVLTTPCTMTGKQIKFRRNAGI